MCPWNSESSTIFPVSTSQFQTIKSCEPEAIRLPSDETATDRTKAVCPRKTDIEAAGVLDVADEEILLFTYDPKNPKKVWKR